MVSLLKSIHVIPKSSTFTFFRTLIVAILGFLWFGFKAEYVENAENVLISSLIHLLSLKKK